MEEATSLPEWAEFYEVEFGRHELITFLKKEILIDISESAKLPFQIINCLPIDIVLTTNYDGLLESVSTKYVSIKRNDEIWKINPSNPTIVKIHSDLDDADNVIVTGSDFYNYQNKFPNLNSYLEYIFSSKCILFLGFGLNDINTNNILYWTRRTLTHSRKSYAVIRNLDPLRKKVLEKRGIVVIDEDVTSVLEKLALRCSNDSEREIKDLEFDLTYNHSSIRRGEKSQIVFKFMNPGIQKITLLTYQFEAYFNNELIGTYKKHIYDERPNTIDGKQALINPFNKVNPLTSYFKSHDSKGNYESRVTVEYVFEGNEEVKIAVAKASIIIE